MSWFYLKRCVVCCTFGCLCHFLREVFQGLNERMCHNISESFSLHTEATLKTVLYERKHSNVARTLWTPTGDHHFYTATHTLFSPPQAVHVMVGLLNIGLGASLAICSSPYPFWLGGMVISSVCPGHFYLKYAHLFTLDSIEIHPKGLSSWRKIYTNTWPALECLIMNAVKLIELLGRSLFSIFVRTQSVFL